jgi:dihydroorotase
MARTLLKNCRIVNEFEQKETDLLLNPPFIERIDKDITDPQASVIDIEGQYLLPGLIDDQVHFREPGLTHKGDIASESRAALAGGITSFMEQPNTNPQTVTLEALEEKHQRAAETAFTNYSFFLGGTNDNLETLKSVGLNQCAGIKLFLGSSTGNMLVDNEEVIERIFSNTPLVIAAHCEDEGTIRRNMEKARAQYGDNIPMEIHPLIRSEEACYLSSSRAIALAKKTGARLHVFHLSTGKEVPLFDAGPIEGKQITAEVCIHHLWFCDEHYAEKGSLIKWNPAVKTAADRMSLRQAVKEDRIDIIATDHAPHTLEEKQNPYTSAPSGGPLVQHALNALWEMQNDIPMEKWVQKMAHNPAIRFKIDRRGFIREGYYGDLVQVNPGASWTVSKENILYKCGWSPFEGTRFGVRVERTWLNGQCAYNQGEFMTQGVGMRLEYTRS